MYTFKSLPDSYRDFRRWRKVDVSQMTDQELQHFSRFEIAIKDYLATGRLKESCLIAHCGRTTLLRQLNRCVTIAEDGEIFGWAGLIMYHRVKKYERRAPLPSAEALKTGNRGGAFSNFMATHPAIEDRLKALILKRSANTIVHQPRISFKGLTRAFRNLCLQYGVQEDEYPLNSKSKARKSITRYAQSLVESHAGRGTWARYGDGAWKHLNVGTGRHSLAPLPIPMKIWGLDAHNEDCIGCVIVPGPAGPQKIPIRRIWFVPVVDFGSKAVMGYSVGIRAEISAVTVEQALLNALQAWKPRDLSAHGLSYMDGAALPTYVFPSLVNCAPALLKIDNAAQHYATRIIENTRKRLSCALSWGGVGRWDHNAVVERLFKTLESYGFHRLPSSTGSFPTDPIKRDAVKQALKIGIEWDHLLDLLDVIIAEYNATPNRGLGGQTPLAVLGNYLDPARPRILLRPLPEPTQTIPALGVIVTVCTVRGSQKSGVRPYVETESARYSNELLAQSYRLVGEKIVLHLNSADVSTAEAYTIEGEPLGTMTANGVWGRVPHSLEIRKEISALINDAAMWLAPGEDPVEKLLIFYADNARADAKKRPNHISAAATKLVKVVHETGREIPQTPSQTEAAPPAELPIRSSSTLKLPSWKTIT